MDNFPEKVIENENDYGRYFCFDTLNEVKKYCLDILKDKNIDIEELVCKNCKKINKVEKLFD